MSDFNRTSIEFYTTQNKEFEQKQKKRVVPFGDSKLYDCDSCKLCDLCSFTRKTKDEAGRWTCGMRAAIWTEEFDKIDLNDPLGAYLSALVDAITEYKMEKLRSQGVLSKKASTLLKTILDNWARVNDLLAKNKTGSTLDWLWTEPVEKLRSEVSEVERDAADSTTTP